MNKSRFGSAMIVLLSVVFSFSTMGAVYGKASISGVFEMNYRHVEDDANNAHTEDEFQIEDVMIFIKGPVGKRANFFSEFMVNPNSADDAVNNAHDQSILVERMYLSTRHVIPEHTAKAGLYQVFDGTIKNYHNAMGNPLPGDVIFFKNPWVGHHANGTLHDVFSELGLSLGGSYGPFSYTVDWFNGRAERTPSRASFDDASPTGLFGKLLWTSRRLPGLQVGLGYYNATSTETTQGVEPQDQYLIPELIYRRPSWTFTALYLDGSQTREVSGDESTALGLTQGTEFDHEGDGFMLEGQYRATSKLTGIARYQTVEPDDENTMNFLGSGTQVGHGGSTEFRGELEQIELGVNYRWDPRVTVKASWQNNEEDGVDAAGDRYWGQLAVSF